MLDINEINKAIEKLESQEMTYGTCEKLSILYTVRDSQARRSAYRNKSDFRVLLENAPFDSVIDILEEHFECVRAIYPKEYEMVMSRIRNL